LKSILTAISRCRSRCCNSQGCYAGPRRQRYSPVGRFLAMLDPQINPRHCTILPAARAVALAVVVLLLPLPALAQPASAPAGVRQGVPAPTRLHAEPNFFLHFTLRGNGVTVRYTPGSLDRSANLQFRLELATRWFEKWTDQPIRLTTHVLSREEWLQSRYRVPYGVPVRASTHALVAPAAGDEDTVALWRGLLDGKLPAVLGLPLLGTPQEVATMILADRVVQLQAAEVLVDVHGLAGDHHWVRGVMAHLVDLSLLRRMEPGSEGDLDIMYSLLGQLHGARELAADDYNADLSLAEWLWFQAQFHAGAKAILDKEGKGAVKAMLKLSRRGKLHAEHLRKRYKLLDLWHRETFTSVSLRPPH